MKKNLKSLFVSLIGPERYHRYITFSEQLVKSLQPFNGTGKGIMAGELIKKGDVILDIGANIGRFVSFACPLIKREGRVVCFEPVTHCRRVLEWMLKLRRCFRASVVPVALSDRVDTLEIAIPLKRGWKLQTSTAHICRAPEENCRLEKVPVLPLDHFCRENKLDRIDFIKCDTEGYEYFVFRGAQQVLSSHKPAIYCEIEEPYVRRQGLEPDAVFDILKKLGYRAFLSVGDDRLKPVDSYSRRGDYFFLHHTKITPRLKNYYISA